MPTQKQMSAMIDGALRHAIQEGSRADAAFSAHVSLTGLPGSGAFLTAPPVGDGREIDAPLFKVALKRRLRVPVYEEEFCCPLCGETMDVWGDHASVCSCGGDRTIRHNAIRNICYQEATDAGLRR